MLAEGLADASTLAGRLAGAYGLPKRLALLPDNPETALRPPSPASHLHAALNKQASLAVMASFTAARDLARLRSCGGPSSGRLFTSRASAADDPNGL